MSGQSAPPALPGLSPSDAADVAQAVAGLEQAVQGAARGLDGAHFAEPFQATLSGMRRFADEAQGDADAPADAIGGTWPSSEDWVRECLRRIDAVPPGRLAWREVDAEGALQRARAMDAERGRGRVRGPLHGMPVGLKDMIDRRGRRSGWGSPMREAAAAASEDATIVARLEAAGAVVLGTQHMAEFAMSPTGLNAAYGPGRNPWNVERVSGGSSSGAGMSVGADHVPLAIGSDTGGSIRLPAALCGVTGLKPTQYRISLAGAMPLSPSLDCLGPLGRSVDHCGWAYVAMAGADPRDPSCLSLPRPVAGWMRRDPRSLRLAVPRPESLPGVTDAMMTALGEVRRVLQARGVTCIDVAVPDMDLSGRLGSVLLAAESGALHRRGLLDPASGYGRQVRRRLSRGLLMRGLDYYDAQRLRAPLLAAFLREAMPQGADALLLPTTPGEAPRVVDTIDRDEALLEREFSLLSVWTRGINYFGLPALSVPAGFTAQGLPLGVQFVGHPLGEDRILALGHQFQAMTDWHRRRPDDVAPAA